MSRPALAACALLFASLPAAAADPRPLWEVEAATPDKNTAPGWVGFAPDGRSVVAVVVRQGAPHAPDFTYQLRVWDPATRKERFNADLGRGKTPCWGDDLASFPSDTTVLTGGETLAVRSLENGGIQSTYSTGGLADHTVWSVPDVQETFHLRRDPDRAGKPVELFYRSPTNNRDELGGLGGRRWRGDDGMSRQAELTPPREGLRPQSVAMNPGRTRMAAAFRDDAMTGRPRHALVLYRVKTVGDLELDPVAEATNPHPGPVSAVAFARNGQTLATGGEDGSVSLWDVQHVGSAWVPRATVAGASGRVVALAWSPDWRFVAAVTWDAKKPNLYLIDADAGALIRTAKLDRELTAVAWSPDGRTIVTGGHSGKLRGWDTEALLKGE